MAYQDLTDNEWQQVAGIVESIVGADNWSGDEKDDPNPDLDGVDPHFVAADGKGRTVMVVVTILRHP